MGTVPQDSDRWHYCLGAGLSVNGVCLQQVCCEYFNWQGRTLTGAAELLGEVFSKTGRKLSVD